MSVEPQSWHQGLIAKWWSEFNREGPEIDYFRRFIEADGQPALDVACGTGRLLIPYVRAGLDVDGCDVSADMVALCREAATREGLSPTLWVQPMHELDPPRRYRTIFVCGAFGLGSSRAQDREALARFYEHLEPGGTLVLDHEVPYADARRWRQWTKEDRPELPEPSHPPRDRRVTSDGSELGLSVRLLDLDPLRQLTTLEIRAEEWRDGELQRREEHVLTMRLYLRNEILLLLELAGFVDVRVEGGHTEAEATHEHDFIVFVARKPEA
jgi:SAM-dependent methyltransferase